MLRLCLLVNRLDDWHHDRWGDEIRTPLCMLERFLFWHNESYAEWWNTNQFES